MEKEDKNHVSSIKLSQVKTSVEASSKISSFFEKLHRINTLHLLSSLLQIVLGSSVVLLSVLDLLQPQWVSTILSMFGSITTMIGLFLFYSLVSNGDDDNKLLRNAMRRIMNSHN